MVDLLGIILLTVIYAIICALIPEKRYHLYAILFCIFVIFILNILIQNYAVNLLIVIFGFLLGEILRVNLTHIKSKEDIKGVKE
ncbi:MAG: hypothetical protein L3J07_03640 [Candidatus Magasanikbacteria bacterium]|nr:hypothetical protein [Candidatus Magasanikbacteria bacterium]